MKLRTLYLQRWASINGRDALSGRILYDRFRELSEETMLAHLVSSDEDAEKFKNTPLSSDIVSQSLLRELNPNILYLEGGLFADSDGAWRIPENLAKGFCTSGGILIVADAECNELSHKKAHYREAGQFFKASIRYGEGEDGDPVYGSDEDHCWKGGHRQIFCNPKKMILDDWVRPVYDGVSEILVFLPGCLSYSDSIIASCNSDTAGTLYRDRWVESSGGCPFAAVGQIGSGFSVFIAGGVSGDMPAQACPHNPIWLTNMATFLLATAEAERTRRLSHRRSPYLLFLSHRSTDKEVVSTISNAIKARGVNVWFDKEQIVVSQSLIKEIDAALGKMTHFVLFWSENCLGAPWVERELNSAVTRLIEQKVPLIIVRLDKTPVPTIVADIFRIEGLGETGEAIGARIAETASRLSRS